MGRDTSSRWFKWRGRASFGLSGLSEMEPMKMIPKGQMWSSWCPARHNVHCLIISSIQRHTLCERNTTVCEIPFRFWGIKWIPTGSGFRAKGSSHPCMNMDSHPAHYCTPLAFPHCWLAFQRVNFYSREMPAVLHTQLECKAADAPEESP